MQLNQIYHFCCLGGKNGKRRRQKKKSDRCRCHAEPQAMLLGMSHSVRSYQWGLASRRPLPSVVRWIIGLSGEHTSCVFHQPAAHRENIQAESIQRWWTVAKGHGKAWSRTAGQRDVERVKQLVIHVSKSERPSLRSRRWERERQREREKSPIFNHPERSCLITNPENLQSKNSCPDNENGSRRFSVCYFLNPRDVTHYRGDGRQSLVCAEPVLNAPRQIGVARTESPWIDARAVALATQWYVGPEEWKSPLRTSMSVSTHRKETPLQILWRNNYTYIKSGDSVRHVRHSLLDILKQPQLWEKANTL